MTTLPDSLIRFGGELERAIARDLVAERSVRHRRTIMRGATALAAAGALAFGVVALVPDNAPVVGRIVDSASAAQRAVAALVPAPGSLVHEVAVHRSAHADGGVTTWREETWRETAAPFRRRHLTTRADGTRVETAAAGTGAAQLYDAATDTIYTNPPASGPALGTPAPAGEGDPLRDQLLQLLRSRDAREVSRQEIGGRGAIRFVYRNAAPDGGVVTWAYLVDAADFTPIRMTVAAAGGSRDTIGFETYESTDGYDERLLSLRAMHPTADVDATEAGYEAALARLSPRP